MIASFLISLKGEEHTNEIIEKYNVNPNCITTTPDYKQAVSSSDKLFIEATSSKDIDKTKILHPTETIQSIEQNLITLYKQGHINKDITHAIYFKQCDK